MPSESPFDTRERPTVTPWRLSRQSAQAKATASIDDERVYAGLGLLLDRQERPVRFRRCRALQTFLRASEIVMHGREEPVRGNFVDEHCRCLAAALQAELEFLVRLGECAELQICPPEGNRPIQVSSSCCASRRELTAARASPCFSCNSPSRILA